jgi:hypothetical protein
MQMNSMSGYTKVMNQSYKDSVPSAGDLKAATTSKDDVCIKKEDCVECKRPQAPEWWTDKK